jgi:hypothetical protein
MVDSLNLEQTFGSSNNGIVHKVVHMLFPTPMRARKRRRAPLETR